MYTKKISTMDHRKLLIWAVMLLFVLPLTGQINVSMSGDAFICEGESVQLTANPSGGDGNYIYLWTPAAGLSCTDCLSPIASPTITTTYTLTVEDGLGEQGSNSVEVVVASAPVVDIGATVVTNSTCDGIDDGAIDLVVTGGAFPATYFWTGPNGYAATTQNISNLPGGQYTVEVTSVDGCSVTATFTVLDGNSITITSNITEASCDGATPGFIDITASGGNPSYTYTWSTGETTEDIFFLAAGIYIVTVTDGNGCSTVENFNVAAGDPVLSVSLQDVSCNGGADGLILVEAGPGDWQFDWSNGFSGPLIQNLAAETYCVTVTNSSTGCTEEACYTVAEPDPLLAFIEATNATCEGEGGSLNVFVTGGTPPYIYLWSNGATTQTISNLPEGVYTVTVVDANGCQVEISSTVLSAPVFSFEIMGLPTEPCVSEFTLTPTIDGGSGSFTYLWQIDGVVVSTSVELVNPLPGVISLTITDDNGCSVTQTVLYDPAPAAVITTSGILSCATGSVVLDGTGSAAGPDYVYEWIGPGGFISDQLIVTVNTPGVYTLTVSNAVVADCSSTAEAVVTDLTLDFGAGIHTTVLGCNDYRLQAIVPDDYFGELAFQWTFPDGITTSSEQTITPTQTGVYTLETEAVGLECFFYSTVFVDLETVACATVSGQVFNDTMGMCILAPYYPTLEGLLIQGTFDGDTYSTFTDGDGHYELNVPAGVEGIVFVTAPSTAWTGCIEVGAIPSLTEGEDFALDFLLQPEVDCAALNVNLSTNILRRCFSSYYYINVTNNGTEIATDAEVVLALDEFLFFEESSLMPTGIIDQTVVWTIDEIAPSETVFFWVKVFVSCDAQLGQTHCSEVYVTPNPLCAPAQNWSGTNLELDADCDGTDVIFTIRNTTMSDLAEAVNYIVIEDGVAMMQSQIIEDLGGDQMETFLFPANGSTYTFQLDQVENHPYSERLSLSIEGCGLNEQNDFSTGFVTQFSQTSSTINNDIFCQENVGSYDPNDKAALPVGYGEQHYIEPETELYYRIRFQNTGTDTAFTVVIRDTLSEHLDLRTLDLGSSSHAYTADIGTNQALTFTFNNILLPDSTTNLEASQGFVDFRISPDVTTPLETVIENDAAIYFDFNDPIITNTVFHTLGRNFLEVVDTKVVPGVALNWDIFPNPVADQLQLNLSGEAVPEALQLQVMDAQGRLLRNVSFSGNTHSLSVADLPAGWYQLRLTLTNGDLLGTAKLVKK